MNNKHISANAYRPADALNAVRRECAKRGIKARKFSVERAAEQRDDQHVAIVVLNTGGTTWNPSRSLCRTYIVSFEVVKEVK